MRGLFGLMDRWEDLNGFEEIDYESL